VPAFRAENAVHAWAWGWGSLPHSSHAGAVCMHSTQHTPAPMPWSTATRTQAAGGHIPWRQAGQPDSSWHQLIAWPAPAAYGASRSSRFHVCLDKWLQVAPAAEQPPAAAAVAAEAQPAGAGLLTQLRRHWEAAGWARHFYWLMERARQLAAALQPPPLAAVAVPRSLPQLPSGCGGGIAPPWQLLLHARCLLRCRLAWVLEGNIGNNSNSSSKQPAARCRWRATAAPTADTLHCVMGWVALQPDYGICWPGTAPKNQKMSPIRVVLLSVPPAVQGLHTPFWALCRSGLDVEVDTLRIALSGGPLPFRGRPQQPVGLVLSLLLHSPW
jgi:hypothetical protein